MFDTNKNILLRKRRVKKFKVVASLIFLKIISKRFLLRIELNMFESRHRSNRTSTRVMDNDLG